MNTQSMDTAACAAQLRSVVVHLSRQLRAGMQHDGLAVAMLSVLSQLHRAGSMTPTELARRESVKLQSLTRLLAELEAQGWIQRASLAADARQSILSITSAGRKRLGAAARGADVPLANAITAHVSVQEQAVLCQASALLARLGDALQEQGGAA